MWNSFSSPVQAAMQRSLEQMIAIKLCVQKWPPLFRQCHHRSCVFEYDPETKRQSAEWHTSGSPHPKNARMGNLMVKTMLIVFFDIRGLIHHDFVPCGTTVNAKFYVEVLKKLKQRVHCIHPDIADDWKLHHDNAPAHTTFLVIHFPADSKVPTVPHLPYSPDMAPPDLFLLPR